MTTGGLPADVHPAVAAILNQAQRLQQVLDDQLHKMSTETFTATDEAKTVEVTLDGHHNLAGLFIKDGLLREGVPTVQQRIAEALANATTKATGSIAADNARINDVIADINAKLNAAI